MGGKDDVAEDDEARLRREEGCRREEAIPGLLKRHDDKRLTIGAGSMMKRTRLPRASVRARILVVMPPLERPMAWL